MTDTTRSPADSVKDALRRAFYLGQTYWQQADSEYTSQHKKADETRAKYEALVEETMSTLAAPSTDQFADAAKMVVLWVRTQTINDDSGLPIGMDEPELKYGADRPVGDGWHPFFSAAPVAWQPIGTAPDGVPLVVGWLDSTDPENPVRHDFDSKEDGAWLLHADRYDDFCMVAPPGSRGLKEEAPYTVWMPLPPFADFAEPAPDEEIEALFEGRAVNTPVISANGAANSRAQIIARAVQAHGWAWPEQLTSGVMFYEGERITKAEFLAEVRA